MLVTCCLKPLFPTLTSSIGPEGKCSAFHEPSPFLQMKMGEELPEDRPDLVPIAMASAKKFAAFQFSSAAWQGHGLLLIVLW